MSKSRSQRSMSLESGKFHQSTSSLDASKATSTALALKNISSSGSIINDLSTTDKFDSQGSAEKSTGMSSKESSPRDGVLLAETKGKKSPRVSIFKKTSPRNSNKGHSSSSNHSSPRSRSSGSPRIAIISSPSLEDEFNAVLPISKREANMLIQVAQIRFLEFTSVENIKKQERLTEEEAQQVAKQRKENGYIFYHLAKNDQGVTKEYPILITGNFSSMIYLADRGQKVGEGANGKLFLAYDLQQEEKCVLKIFNKKTESKNAIFKEMNHLALLGRFRGYFVGKFKMSETTDSEDDKDIHGIIMRLEPGVALIEYLYQTDQTLKLSTPYYKEMIDYYQSKKRLTYINRLALAESIVKALCEIHQVPLIHRDISCDNILVNEKDTHYQSCVIDFDVAIHTGCDVVLMRTLPERDQLYKLTFSSNAAYIRCNDQLYYINKEMKKCDLLNIGTTLIKWFDGSFHPEEKSRALTADELKEISGIIEHKHEAPKHAFLNVAYGYAPPELCKIYAQGESKAYASFASDIYSLGVVLADIFSDINLQKMLRAHHEIQKKKAIDSKKQYFREELSVSELKAMVTDIFSVTNLSQQFDVSNETIKDYIYRIFILPKISTILIGLLAEEPGQRLKGSSLAELAKQFSDMEVSYRILCESLEQLTVEICSLQTNGITLKALAEVISNIPTTNVGHYFARSIARLFTSERALTFVDNDEDPANFLMLSAALITSVRKIYIGREAFRGLNVAIYPFKSLIANICPDGDEAWEFLSGLMLGRRQREEKNIACQPI